MMTMTETVTVSGVSADASVPPTMTALEQKRQKRIEVEAIEEAELEASIPKPVGYRVLIVCLTSKILSGKVGLLRQNLPVERNISCLL
jgi:hypothetical protein